MHIIRMAIMTRISRIITATTGMIINRTSLFSSPLCSGQITIVASESAVLVVVVVGRVVKSLVSGSSVLETGLLLTLLETCGGGTCSGSCCAKDNDKMCNCAVI